MFSAAGKQPNAAETRPKYGANHHLSFESAKALFSEFTPARIDLLEALRQCGPCSVYALAKTVERNYSNVHTDVGKLEEHGLIRRAPDEQVFVPFESVEIHLILFRKAALPAQTPRSKP